MSSNRGAVLNGYPIISAAGIAPACLTGTESGNLPFMPFAFPPVIGYFPVLRNCLNKVVDPL
jgi:hypothetical protein